MGPLQLVVVAVVWTWLGLFLASQVRSRTWTLAGLMLAMSNRDSMPTPTQFAQRLDRIANNMRENLLLFATLVLAAHLLAVDSGELTRACWLFLGARLAYFVVGVAGIPVVRTLLWFVGVGAMGWIVALCLTR